MEQGLRTLTNCSTEIILSCDIASGRYRAIIPTLIGDAEPRLQRLDGAAYISMLEREVWLLVHTDLANLARIKAVGGWLEGLFKPGAQ